MMPTCVPLSGSHAISGPPAIAPFDRYRDRAHRNDYKILRDGKIMHQRWEWPANQMQPNQLAALVRNVELDFAVDTAGRKVSKEQHLAGSRDRSSDAPSYYAAACFRSSSDRSSRATSGSISIGPWPSSSANSLFPCQMRLVFATPSVRMPATLGSESAGNARSAEQRSTGRVFQIPVLRPHPSIAIGHLAALHMEGMHHSVTIERVVVPARRELRTRPDAIEGAVELRRELRPQASNARSRIRSESGQTLSTNKDRSKSRSPFFSPLPCFANSDARRSQCGTPLDSGFECSAAARLK